MSADSATDAPVVGGAGPKGIPRDIWAFFTARTLSQLGNYLQFMALPLWVLSVTGSVTATGLAFAIEVLPAVFLAPWVGYLVDRYDRRNLLAVCEAMSAVAVVGLLVAVSFEAIPFVYVAALFIRIFDAFGMPTVSAILTSRVDKPHQPRAIAALEAQAGAVITIGPIAGTLIYSQFGIHAVLIVNLVSFVAGSVIVAFLPACPGTGTPSGVRAAMADAMRIIVRDEALRSVALAEIVYFLCFGGITTLATVIAEQSMGARLTGLYMGGVGFGWLLGSTLIVRRFGRHSRALLFIGIVSCTLVGLVIWKVIELGPVACFAGGVLAGIVNVLIVSATTVMFSDRLPHTMMGRAVAVRRAGINLALALSHMALAATAVSLGPGATGMITGVVTALVGSAVLAPLLLAGARRPTGEKR